MSIWLAEHDLPGFSTWMRKQSGDELLHAQRIIDHLVERDQKVVLPGVAAPPMSWKSAEALCAHVLKNERTSPPPSTTCARWPRRDRPATIMLRGFVNEQMEEEPGARGARTHPSASNTGVGLLMIGLERPAATWRGCRPIRQTRRAPLPRSEDSPIPHRRSPLERRHRRPFRNPPW
jgi:ferritin